jgi:hypothetical protein
VTLTLEDEIPPINTISRLKMNQNLKSYGEITRCSIKSVEFNKNLRRKSKVWNNSKSRLRDILELNTVLGSLTLTMKARQVVLEACNVYITKRYNIGSSQYK